MPLSGTEPRDATFDTAAADRVAGSVAAPWIVSVFVASLALWVGAAVFLSAAVLPILFINLEPSEAGKIAALVFPIYFQAGLAVGVVAAACSLMLARAGGRRWQVVFAVVACMTLAQGWSALVLHPEMADIRGLEDKVARFQELHVLSVRLNAVVLAGGTLLLAAAGFLLSPRRARA